jgi:hypothetical protein
MDRQFFAQFYRRGFVTQSCDKNAHAVAFPAGSHGSTAKSEPYFITCARTVPAAHVAATRMIAATANVTDANKSIVVAAADLFSGSFRQTSGEQLTFTQPM